MRKIHLWILAGIFFVITIIPLAASGVQSSTAAEYAASVTADNTGTQGFDSLEKAVAYANTLTDSNIVVTLHEDAVLKDRLMVFNSMTIKSDENGPFTVKRDESYNNYLLVFLAPPGQEAVNVNVNDLIIDGGSGEGTEAIRAAMTVGTSVTSGGEAVECPANVQLGSGVIVRNNNNTTSNGLGGGICVYNGTLTLSGATVTGNQSAQGGGIGLFQETASLVINSGSINNNVAPGGGGIHQINGTTHMLGGIIENNKATDSTGGGVRVSKGDFYLEDGSISGNQSETYGAGVYINEGNLYMTDGTIAYNVAERTEPSTSNDPFGGGVFVLSGCFQLSGGTIENNKACYGTGVTVWYDGTFVMSGGSIMRNEAGTAPHTSATSFHGGGVCVYGNANTSFEMSGGSITENKASRGGGIVSIGNGTLKLSGGSISNNHATEKGGGVYVTPAIGALTISDDMVIRDNTHDVQEYGENLFLDSKDTFCTYTVGAMAETAEVNFYSVMLPAEGEKMLIGTPEEGSTITKEDVKKFICEDSKYMCVMQDDGNMYLIHTADLLKFCPEEEEPEDDGEEEPEADVTPGNPDSGEPGTKPAPDNEEFVDDPEPTPVPNPEAAPETTPETKPAPDNEESVDDPEPTPVPKPETAPEAVQEITPETTPTPDNQDPVNEDAPDTSDRASVLLWLGVLMIALSGTWKFNRNGRCK